MIKSNSKKALNNIRSYILKNTDLSVYGIENKTEFKATAKELMHIFYDEKVKYDKRRISYQELFIEWLQGLPSVFNAMYYYNENSKDIISELLEETEEETNRYTDEQADRFLSCLIWREIYKACDYTIE